ncbi:hypothetical protein BH09PLA1_BH09PLA1_19880 [soil metagenome]
MIHSMKPAATIRSSVFRRLAIAFALAVVYITPVPALAADEEKGPLDARLENYPTKVTLEESGSALSWILFLVLTALCVGVMFKSANRSHLD